MRNKCVCARLVSLELDRFVVHRNHIPIFGDYHAWNAAVGFDDSNLRAENGLRPRTCDFGGDVPLFVGTFIFVAGVCHLLRVFQP